MDLQPDIELPTEMLWSLYICTSQQRMRLNNTSKIRQRVLYSKNVEELKPLPAVNYNEKRGSRFRK